ncbi:hypothetical protein AJ78_03874 [Emergomyces pasteurianus Ep9510]|uniref:Uncharacterized protein n=1 Tax=Emergomyces pasteurianus Ep9510 TaxID=1447872 RepID=A0A1J9QIA7_9EURO|nr:hypothetical protein AJ78_03874 [Emergomyces pasteurianus Ep9510]
MMLDICLQSTKSQHILFRSFVRGSLQLSLVYVYTSSCFNYPLHFLNILISATLIALGALSLANLTIQPKGMLAMLGQLGDLGSEVAICSSGEIQHKQLEAKLNNKFGLKPVIDGVAAHIPGLAMGASY